MDEHDWMAERFEEHRTHLRAVAYRMLGSPAEADDAVQESWIRLSRLALSTGPGVASHRAQAGGVDGGQTAGPWLCRLEL
jgi:DNA-directed RNA polymerase specialized sigma24 family protein